MNVLKLFTITVIGLISVLFFSLTWASGKGRSFDLALTPAHPEAEGTAVIDRSHVSIQARGLKPDSVYTVWFVNMKPNKHETGAGSAPYMSRTNKWGDGIYTAPLREAPFGRWSMLMVVLHPTGDPKDMQNMVGALKAPL